MRTPNLNSLRMFDAAARHLNFRLAAEELHLSQGAVAQQVRRLEAELAVVLFQRQARGLALTDQGRSYHLPVRRALALIDGATRALHPQVLQLTLSVPPSFAAKWLVPRQAEFARLHPDIDLRTVASESIAGFHNDGADIAIRQGCPPFGAGLRADLLAPLDLCAVCSAGYEAASPPVYATGDLLRHQRIQDGHHHWDRLFGPRPDRPGQTRQRDRPEQRILQFNQTALALEAAANGQGVAITPRILVETDLASGRLVQLWQLPVQDASGFYVVRPEDAGDKTAHQRLTGWLLAEAGA
jgi:LysR family transcriptional regulator, glycine cleavage system transcriptional activator